MKLSAEIIRPFLASTKEVLDTMAFVKSKHKAAYLETSKHPTGAVTGVIKMNSTTLEGILAVSFSKICILKIADKMWGESFNTINDDIKDMVGEFTNIIAGGVKRRLYAKGYRFGVNALPSVVKGQTSIFNQPNSKRIIIPFICDEGELWLEVFFKKVIKKS